MPKGKGAKTVDKAYWIVPVVAGNPQYKRATELDGKPLMQGGFRFYTIKGEPAFSKVDAPESMFVATDRGSTPDTNARRMRSGGGAGKVSTERQEARKAVIEMQRQAGKITVPEKGPICEITDDNAADAKSLHDALLRQLKNVEKFFKGGKVNTINQMVDWLNTGLLVYDHMKNKKLAEPAKIGKS